MNDLIHKMDSSQHKVVKTIPLVFYNPFFTTHFQNPSQIVFDSYIPTGFDLSQYQNSLKPTGYHSLEQRDMLKNLLSQLQRKRSGILTEKERMLQSILSREKKKKQKELQDKIIQYIAEGDEQDFVDTRKYPVSLRNQVIAYRKAHPEAENKAHFNRRARLIRNLKTKLESGFPLTEREYDFLDTMKESKISEATEMPSDMKTYDTWHDTTFGDLYEKMKEEEEAENLKEENEEDNESSTLSSIMGKGYFDEVNTGILRPSAPFVHRLIHPIGEMEIFDPKREAENQQRAIDKNREEYKRLQTQQRGIEPPREMVKRAFPETVEPIIPNEIILVEPIAKSALRRKKVKKYKMH